MAPVEEHSKKPDIFLEMIEFYYPNLPKLELGRRGLRCASLCRAKAFISSSPACSGVSSGSGGVSVPGLWQRQY